MPWRVRPKTDTLRLLPRDREMTKGDQGMGGSIHQSDVQSACQAWCTATAFYVGIVCSGSLLTDVIVTATSNPARIWELSNEVESERGGGD